MANGLSFGLGVDSAFDIGHWRRSLTSDVKTAQDCRTPRHFALSNALQRGRGDHSWL
jgi:hypothetical protein